MEALVRLEVLYKSVKTNVGHSCIIVMSMDSYGIYLNNIDIVKHYLTNKLTTEPLFLLRTSLILLFIFAPLLSFKIQPV